MRGRQEDLKQKPQEVKGTIMRHQNEQKEVDDEDHLGSERDAVKMPRQPG